MAEFVVKIKWLHTVDEDDGIKDEVCSYRNIVCRPKTKSWADTVLKIKELWNIND